MSVSAFRDILRAKLLEVSSQHHAQWPISSVSIDCDVIDVMSIVMSWTGMGQWVFRHRDTGVLTAGMGQLRTLFGPASFHVQAIQSMTDTLNDSHPDVRFFGCHQFADSGSNFYYGYAIPKLMIVQRQDRCQVFYFFTTENLSELLAEFDQVCDTFSPDLPQKNLVEMQSMYLNPDLPEWLDLVKDAQATISQGKVGKLVLARQAIISGEVSGGHVISDCLRSGFHGFLFWSHCPFGEHGDIKDVFGASPELLFSRDGDTIVSEAIAGTAAQTDLDFLDRLKDRKEHRWVLDMVQSTMATLCDTVSGDAHLSLIQGNGVQHLYCKVSGTRHVTTTDADIWQALHPTPAVCGFPKHAAFDFILSHEPFDRGIYTGSIGLFGKQSTCMVVAIRCGIVQNEETILVTGAGIVAESDARAEWDELDLKLQSLVEVVAPS